MPHTGPVGIFDSGIGGLSILRALRCLLPAERFVYLADSAHAPYGDTRSRIFVQQRALDITACLLAQHHIKALVIACNTATVAAAALLRARWPDLPIIGVEPAIKPAAAATRSGHVGVLATRSTLASQRFMRLLRAHGRTDGQGGPDGPGGPGVCFHLQPCDGLARAIETACAPGGDPHAAHALCLHYARQLGTLGGASGQIDTLVLGCTHYAFCLPALREALGKQIRLLHPAHAVARQAQRRLAQAGRLACGHGGKPGSGAGSGHPGEPLQLLDTSAARPDALRHAAQQWLPPG